MKVLENKIQEQSKEISIRSKTIEELQYSLNILIEKYNELKKKYDVVNVQNKDNKIRNSSNKIFFLEKNYSFKILGENKINVIKVLEDENIRIKYKLFNINEEHDKFTHEKENEIHSLKQQLNELSSKYHILNEKNFQELKTLNEKFLIENNKLKEISEKSNKKYHK